MVLGANLIPMKKDQVVNICKDGVAGTIMNATASYNLKNNFQQTMSYDEEMVKQILNMNES